VPYKDPAKRAEYDRGRNRWAKLSPEEKKEWIEQGNERRRSWREANPELAKLKDRKRALARYNLTIEQFEEKLAEQGGACASCGRDNTAARNWHVDHNHDTGEFRGILCHYCNVAAGCLGDDTRNSSGSLRITWRGGG
jgi:hypothetical protein